jgi:hypothetical protein
MAVGIMIMAFWCAMSCGLLYRNLLSPSSDYMKNETHLSKIRRTFKMFPESLFSEKYTTLQSFKLHFLQDLPLVQLYNSDSDCNGVENIPGSNFVTTFSALPSLF